MSQSRDRNDFADEAGRQFADSFFESLRAKFRSQDEQCKEPAKTDDRKSEPTKQE